MYYDIDPESQQEPFSWTEGQQYDVQVYVDKHRELYFLIVYAFIYIWIYGYIYIYIFSYFEFWCLLQPTFTYNTKD